MRTRSTALVSPSYELLHLLGLSFATLAKRVLSLGYLPASVMLPPRRLDILLQQALETQENRCQLHNTGVPLALHTHSVLTDHSCGRYETIWR